MTAEQVKVLLQPYSGQIRQCVTSGCEALERLRSRAPEECAPIPKRTLAGIIHAHMVYEARKAFSGMAPDILLNDSTGFLIVDFFGRIKLRFKRLSPRLHPSNIPTGQQQAVEDQTLFGPAVTLVTAGYTLTEAGTFKNVYIVCWGASGYQWSFPLLPVAGEMANIERLSSDGDLPEPIVRVKATPEVRAKDAG